MLLVAMHGPRLAHAAASDCQALPECDNLMNQGKSAHNGKDYISALELYAKAYELVPDARLLVLMGRSRAKQGEHAVALGLYRRAQPLLVEEEAIARTRQFIEESEQALASARAVEPSGQDALAPKPALAATTTGRPLWRLVTGGIALGGGILMGAFGISALSHNGRCADQPAPTDENLCMERFGTLGVGSGFVGTGAALAVGGTILLALPGSRSVQPAANEANGK
ncbi:MAG: hypothetical protein U1A78_34895 [Polyangia bacterium]